MFSLNKTLVNYVVKGKPAERKYVCSRNFIYFALYYFSEYFTYPLAPFHYDMFTDLHEMVDEQKFNYLMWVMFRESAKTTISKMFVVWCICYGFKRYINWDSYVKDTAESALYDITLALQINKLLIADFGHLYTEKRSSDSEKKIKRVAEFVTVNKVKVQAFSTQESTRGRVFGPYRPDLHVYDDFETSKTKASAPTIKKIQEHIDEMMAGLSADANVIFLCNLLTEAGVVKSLMDGAGNDPRFRVRRVDAEINGKPAWPDKYTITDKEAILANRKITDVKKQKVSLEAKKRTLNMTGRKVYEVEMMNSPEAAGDLIFDRKIIDKLLLKCENATKDIAGFKIWGEYNPSHRYAIGADTSKGVGRDSNASIVIDFSTSKPQVVGRYKNNLISPDLFGYELRNQGNMFGQCLIAPETNNTGYATLAVLKQIYDLKKIWQKVPEGKVIDKPNKDLGWDTNGATKPDMIFQLKSAILDGNLEVLDEAILKEARSYSQSDLQDLNPDPEGTRHFDLLIACAIAWAMRNYAQLPDAELLRRDYKQPEYQPSVLERNSTDVPDPFSEQFKARNLSEDYEQKPFEPKTF